jgi:hypothetical protein
MKFYWAIFSGKTLLPFTIRTTKKQCISDRKFNVSRELLDHESCRKVLVTELVNQQPAGQE